MDTIIIHIEPDKTQLLKNFLTSINVKFQISALSPDKPYDPTFVAEILESRQQLKEGKVTRIKTEDLWK